MCEGGGVKVVGYFLVADISVSAFVGIHFSRFQRWCHNWQFQLLSSTVQVPENILILSHSSESIFYPYFVHNMRDSETIHVLSI